MRKKQSTTGVLIIRGIPEPLKNRFKAACYAKGKTMAQVIIELMEKATKNKGAK